MKISRIKGKHLFWGAMALLFAPVIFFIAMLATNDEYEACARGSLRYHLFLDSEIIRKFPAIPGVKEGSLGFSLMSEGTKPAYDSMKLMAAGGFTDEQLKQIDAYLQSHGFVNDAPFDPSGTGWSYTRGRKQEKHWIKEDFVELKMDDESGRKQLYLAHLKSN